MADWHYIAHGQQAGPVSFEQLKGMAASGQLTASDNVWEVGSAGWVPAGTVPGLFAGASAPPPPAPGGPGAPPPPPISHSAPAVQAPPFNPQERMRRILLIAAGGALFVTFFTPLFILHVSSPTVDVGWGRTVGGSSNTVMFGWDYWWGILIFIFGLFAAGAAVTGLLMERLAILRFILQWVYLGLFGIVGLFSVLGFLLGLFGAGTGYRGMLHDAGYSVWGIPICIVLVLGAAAVGVFISLQIVMKEKFQMPRH